MSKNRLLKSILFFIMVFATAGSIAQTGEKVSSKRQNIISNTVSAQDNRIPAKGLGVTGADNNFKTIEFTRHSVGDNDVLLEILYAGICHSDIHSWEGQRTEKDTLVPGHEIVGRVTQIGKNVTKFKLGDFAGVGCMVNSCGQCSFCLADKEQFCENRPVFTYGSTDHFHDNEITRGGYSSNLVLSEKFAIKVPANADIKKVAPLLCAGVTTWSPIHFSKVKKGDKVGVAGYGGLGHMAVKYAVDLGANVTVFDIVEQKRSDALRMGAVKYVNVNKPEDLKELNNTFDFIISTIPNDYDAMMYVRMLKMDGEMAIVGLPRNTNVNITSLIWAAHRKVYGSLIGGIKETQEMLDYSVAHNIYPEVEIIKADGKTVTDVYHNIVAGKIKFRYVIDMKTLK